MQAVRIHETGGPEVLRVEDVPDPTLDPGQVVVEVAAAGVNFIDIYQRTGVYPLDLPVTLGLEGAGTIVAVADDVTDRVVGERVAWTDQLGSYAQRHAIAADRTVRVPDGVDPVVAGGLLLQGLTAHYLTHSTFRLGADHTALVYAPAGGVGRLLVQLAVRRGARVLAVTSTPDKAAIATALGADAVLDRRRDDLPAAVRELTDGHGVDVVYDSVGRDTFDASLACLKPRGLMVLYGASSGQVPPVDLQVLNRGGSLYVTRPTLGHHIATADELAWRAGAILDQVAAGLLHVEVHPRTGLTAAPEAHTDLASGTTTGKLVLVP